MLNLVCFVVILSPIRVHFPEGLKALVLPLEDLDAVLLVQLLDPGAVVDASGSLVGELTATIPLFNNCQSPNLYVPVSEGLYTEGLQHVIL